MFTIAGEHLTLRMRRLAFEAMLSQEIGWFDEPTNGTGALCARLSADAAAIQGVSSTYIVGASPSPWGRVGSVRVQWRPHSPPTNPADVWQSTGRRDPGCVVHPARRVRRHRPPVEAGAGRVGLRPGL